MTARPPIPPDAGGASETEEPPIDVLDSAAAGPAAIRGGALRGFGYGLGLVLSAASVPLVVRHLGIEDFGRFVLVTALITLVGGLTEVGLQSVGMREYSTRTGADRDRLMANLLGVRLTVTVVGVALALLFTVLAGYDRTLVFGTAVGGLGLLVQSTQTLFAVPLSSQLRLGWTTAAELVRQSTGVLLTLVLVAAGASLFPFYCVTVPGAVLSVALTAYLVRGMMPFVPHFDPAEWWLLLRDTVAYAVAIAVNVTYFRIAIVIMSLLATELETGYFAASFRVLEVLLPIPALVVGAVFPILARAARDDLERLAYASQRIIDVALIAGAGIVLALELAAPVVMDVLASDAGKPSVAVLRIQAPALLATFIAVGCGFSLLSLRRHRDMLVANLVALLFSVALTFALVPGSGARGAAVATSVAEWALALVTLALLLRAMAGFRLSVLRTGVPVLAGAALGACALLLPVPAVVQTVVGLGVYGALLVVTRTVPPELADAVRTRLHRA